MHKLRNLSYIIIICAIAVFAADLLRQQFYKQYVVSTSKYMDTVVSLIAHNPKIKKNLLTRINDDFISTIKETSALFNIYNKDSRIAKINSSFSETTFVLQTDVYNVLDKSLYFFELTNGYFDITVGSLVKLWKNAAKQNVLPSDEDIYKTLDITGYQKVTLDKNNHSVSTEKKGLKLNPSGIAKGYIVDKAVKKIRDLYNIENIVVNAGGDLYAGGSSKRRFFWQKKGWTVGIKHPRKPHLLLGTIVVSDKAVATSGDYERPLKIAGKKYSHIIDPKTGYPTEFIVSATVIAPDCASADALATSITVMGIDSGLALIESLENTEALIVTEENDQTNLFFSSGFKNYGFKENKINIIEKHFK